MKVNGWKGVSDDAKEEAREIELTRRQADASGEILWHAKPLLRNTNGIADVLPNQVYDQPALVPASPWLSAEIPGKPLLQAGLEGGDLKLTWNSSGGPVWQWVLQKKTGGHWSTEILAGTKTGETIKSGPTKTLPEAVALFAINRFGNASSGTTYRQTP
jgi:hypothetical protein